MSGVSRSPYPSSFRRIRNQMDVDDPDPSLRDAPYAHAYMEYGEQLPRDHQQIPPNWSPNHHCQPQQSPGYSPHHSDRRPSQCAATFNYNAKDGLGSKDSLKKEQQRLKRYNRRLFVLLVVMVVMLIVTVIPLSVVRPAVFKGFYFFGDSAEVLGVCQSCSTSSSSSPEGNSSLSDFCEIEQRCTSRVGGGGGDCRMDVSTAMCILTETKTALMNRTRRLDVSVYEDNKRLKELLHIQSENNISGFYHSRPSGHFSKLFYSHVRLAGEPGPLVLFTKDEGLSPVREMNVTRDKGQWSGFKVTKDGYYFVYSQVFFKGHAAGNTFSHRVCRTTKNNKCFGKALLERGHGMPSQDGGSWLSFLQGVFQLNAGDALSVFAEHSLINVTYRDLSFFGAFLV